MSNWDLDRIKHCAAAQQADELLNNLYGSGPHLEENLQRVQRLLSQGPDASHVFSAPGRTELGGNHTDHNLGKVLCAAVKNDTLAVVKPRQDDIIKVHSEGFETSYALSYKELDPEKSEQGSSTALIRGVLAGIHEFGGNLGGFEAWVTSNVGVGSGLSSSASFEVLIGTIVNDLYNEGDISAKQIAVISQRAENEYFGKPCGLMDQMASAVGGISMIDFANPTDPEIQTVHFDLQNTDFVLLVVHTGSSHDDLTYAYASIPEEMKAVANMFEVDTLNLLAEQNLVSEMALVREKLGERSLLRALHFYSENRRVDRMLAALEASDFNSYLENIAASGLSSQNLLQNAIPPKSDGKSQGLALALGLSQLFFEEKGRGVARVHGGGFAGTIQAYVHIADLKEYSSMMTSTLHSDAVQILNLRESGACKVLDLNT